MANQEIDPRAAIKEFLPAAEAISADQILPFRLDVALANANIQLAMPVVARHAATIATDLPNIDLPALQALPALGVALTHATLEAERVVPSEATVQEYLAEGYTLRRLLLTSFHALAIAELVPQHEYDEIARGSGMRDMAEDCVALPSVFAKYQQVVTNKHPVTPQQIDRCAIVGGWLTRNLRPVGTKTASVEQPVPPEVLTRNRLATLLINRYEELRKVAFYYYGRKANQHVPPLQSRRRRKAPTDTDASRAAGGSEPGSAGA